MTLQEAIKEARDRSTFHSSNIYVVNDCGEYDTATTYDLDTFFLGCEITHTFLGGEWLD